MTKFLARCLVILCCVPVAASSAPGALATGAGARGDVDAGVRQAFLFAFPVYQIARTRTNAVAIAAAEGRTVINRFGHRARLASPSDRAVTTPNNDTLYSSAWLDLSQGSVLLQVPPLPDRYHSVALMDVFTDNFAVLGTGTDRGRGGRYLITGPDWHGVVPKGTARIRSPTNDVWALARVLVDGPADLPEAAADQARLMLSGPAGSTVATAPARLPAVPDARSMLATVNALLGHSGVPAAHREAAFRAAPFGAVAGGGDRWNDLPLAVRDSWVRQFPAMLAGLREGVATHATVRNGWSYPAASIGRFGHDAAYRAAVALGGLAALPSWEALYISRAGEPDRCATLDVPPVPVALQGFWSLTMYQRTLEGQQFFVPNSLDRYAIGNRTPGLVRRANGAIRIVIAPRPPAEGTANWLPAPPGPWEVTFRIYRPMPIIMSGGWSLPELRVLSC